MNTIRYSGSGLDLLDWELEFGSMRAIFLYLRFIQRRGFGISVRKRSATLSNGVANPTTKRAGRRKLIWSIFKWWKISCPDNFPTKGPKITMIIPSCALVHLFASHIHGKLQGWGETHNTAYVIILVIPKIIVIIQLSLELLFDLVLFSGSFPSMWCCVARKWWKDNLSEQSHLFVRLASFVSHGVSGLIRGRFTSTGSLWFWSSPFFKCIV